MVITVVGVALLVAAFAVPNYLAVRYAVFGGAPGASAAGGAALAHSGVQKDRLAFARRGYLWKALSPLLFAVSVILGLALGGVLGLALVGLALLNLVFGFIGWDGFIAGRK